MLVASQQRVSQLESDFPLGQIKIFSSLVFEASFGPEIHVTEMRQALIILLELSSLFVRSYSGKEFTAVAPVECFDEGVEIKPVETRSPFAAASLEPLQQTLTDIFT